jgi:hypothetical protein
MVSRIGIRGGVGVPRGGKAIRRRLGERMAIDTSRPGSENVMEPV